MHIGVPRETKSHEGRIAFTPAAVQELVDAGHAVSVETGAGVASGFADSEYLAAGARTGTRTQVWSETDIVVKVKEPQSDEVAMLQAGQTLFCFLHLAAVPDLGPALAARGVTALAFEMLFANGALPLLAPMSEIAGRLSIQIGAHLLEQAGGGRGVLLGGIPGVETGRVVVLGAGTAGLAAAGLAAAFGTAVEVFDLKREALGRARAIGPNVSALFAEPAAIGEAVRAADLVIGAVLVPGARAPVVVTRAMVEAMRPGSVIVDISVDQGGCVATTRPMHHGEAPYAVNGVLHSTITNLPGIVPRTSTLALSGVLMPWVRRLANPDWRGDPALAGAISVDDQRVI
ncbi:MAG: alanine dehydrogenase [Chromatiales bacterium]|nr:alanine dehydrogenase [Chromatiales bacterium]